MSSGWLGSQRNRFNSATSTSSNLSGSSDAFDPELFAATGMTVESERLGAAITRTRDWMLDNQHPDGFWVGEPRRRHDPGVGVHPVADLARPR